MSRHGLRNKKHTVVIFIALGSNLPSNVGPSSETCLAAVREIEKHEIAILKVSRWYESSPVPASDQPNYVNGVVSVETDHSPAQLLKIVLKIEQKFGRVRSEKNAPRTLDLDVLAYHARIESGPPEVPHPRLHERAFVLRPLQDVAPGWRHPETGKSVEELILALEAPDSAVPLPF